MTDQEKLQAERLKRALQGTDSGSDTRAGSLRGGSASGSEEDPDSEAINADLAQKGRELAAEKSASEDDKPQPKNDVP